MFYICKEGKDGTFGVMDTRDGIVEYYTPKQIISIVFRMNIPIEGVIRKSNGKVSIKVMQPSSFSEISEHSFDNKLKNNKMIGELSEKISSSMSDFSVESFNNYILIKISKGNDLVEGIDNGYIYIYKDKDDDIFDLKYKNIKDEYQIKVESISYNGLCNLLDYFNNFIRAANNLYLFQKYLIDNLDLNKFNGKCLKDYSNPAIISIDKPVFDEYSSQLVCHTIDLSDGDCNIIMLCWSFKTMDYYFSTAEKNINKYFIEEAKVLGLNNINYRNRYKDDFGMINYIDSLVEEKVGDSCKVLAIKLANIIGLDDVIAVKKLKNGFRVSIPKNHTLSNGVGDSYIDINYGYYFSYNNIKDEYKVDFEVNFGLLNKIVSSYINILDVCSNLYNLRKKFICYSGLSEIDNIEICTDSPFIHYDYFNIFIDCYALRLDNDEFISIRWSDDKYCINIFSYCKDKLEELGLNKLLELDNMCMTYNELIKCIDSL